MTRSSRRAQCILGCWHVLAEGYWMKAGADDGPAAYAGVDGIRELHRWTHGRRQRFVCRMITSSTQPSTRLRPLELRTEFRDRNHVQGQRRPGRRREYENTIATATRALCLLRGRPRTGLAVAREEKETLDIDDDPGHDREHGRR